MASRLPGKQASAPSVTASKAHCGHGTLMTTTALMTLTFHLEEPFEPSPLAPLCLRRQAAGAEARAAPLQLGATHVPLPLSPPPHRLELSCHDKLVEWSEWRLQA